MCAAYIITPMQPPYNSNFNPNREQSEHRNIYPRRDGSRIALKLDKRNIQLLNPVTLNSSQKYFGVMWGYVGLYWGYIGVIWGYIGVVLGLYWGYWGYMGLYGVILGLDWGYIGVIWGYSGVIYGVIMGLYLHPQLNAPPKPRTVNNHYNCRETAPSPNSSPNSSAEGSESLCAGGEQAIVIVRTCL